MEFVKYIVTQIIIKYCELSKKFKYYSALSFL